jgi:hypothetical protein
MASHKAINFHEETSKYFSDYMIENKALRYFLDGFEEGGSQAFSESVDF